MALTKLQAESLNLADTYAFTGTITGAGEPSYYVKLADTSASNVSTVSFDYFTSDYKVYKIYLNGVYGTADDTWFRLRLNSSIGTPDTASNYKYLQSHVGNYNGGSVQFNGSSGFNETNLGIVYLMNGYANTMGKAEITIFKPTDASTYTHIFARGSSGTGSGGAYYFNSYDSFCDYNVAKAHTGVTFFSPGGNLYISHIQIYGLK